MNKILTLDSALNVILDATKKHAPECDGMKPILCEGSLGGSIGVEMVGRFPEIYAGAVITMAGQNGGVDRGCHASVGLTFLEFVTEHFSAKTLLHAMWSEAIKNGHIPLFQQKC